MILYFLEGLILGILVPVGTCVLYINVFKEEALSINIKDYILRRILHVSH